MAFTVEDGTGLAGANALAAIADVAAYLADRGLSAFGALTEAQQQAAVVQATDYLSAAYEWLGIKLADDQALALPTDEIAAGEDLPLAVLAALSRLAFAVGVSSVNLFGTVSAQSAVQSVKAGSVQVDFSQQAISLATAGRPSFPWLLELLAPYIVDAGSSWNVKVVRT